MTPQEKASIPFKLKKLSEKYEKLTPLLKMMLEEDLQKRKNVPEMLEQILLIGSQIVPQLSFKVRQKAKDAGPDSPETTKKSGTSGQKSPGKSNKSQDGSPGKKKPQKSSKPVSKQENPLLTPIFESWKVREANDLGIVDQTEIFEKGYELMLMAKGFFVIENYQKSLEFYQAASKLFDNITD